MGKEENSSEKESSVQLKELVGEKYNALGLDIQNLIFDIKALTQLVEEKDRQLLVIQKELADNQWYLGEERAKVNQLQEELHTERKLLKEKEEYINQLQETIHKFSKQSEESDWYLGEEKVARKNLESKLQENLQYINKLEEENQKVKRHWEESEWYLNEERAKTSSIV